MKFVAFSSCLQFFTIVGASWLNRHVLPQLLNCQIQLDLILESGVPLTQQQRYSGLRKQLERSLMLALAFIMALAPAVLLSINTQAHADFFAEVFVISFVLAYLWFSAVLQQSIIILNFRKLRQLFERVESDMHVWSDGKYKRVRQDVLDGWCDTLLLIRYQAHLLSRYLAPTLLPALLLAIVLCTLCLFFSVNVTQGLADSQESSEKLSSLFGNLSCVVVTLATLYCNANLAQKITNKVPSLSLCMDVRTELFFYNNAVKRLSRSVLTFYGPFLSRKRRSRWK